MSSSKSEFDKILAQYVHAASLISDEDEAEAVWKGILSRKGLPLDTPYKYVDTFNKAYDESYCDRLFATIHEKNKNLEAEGLLALDPLSGKPSSSSSSSSFFCTTSNERKRKSETLASEMSSSKSEWDKNFAQHVHAASKISDEDEAEAVWKGILVRKGLPLDTPYDSVHNSHKAYDESYCDRLFATIREKKKNPEAAKSRGHSTFEWLPAPAPPKKTDDYFSGRTFRDHFGAKVHKNIRSINHICYDIDEVSKNKRTDFLQKRREKNIKSFKEKESMFGPALFLRHL